ncbi:MAG: nicotinate-nucleotide adenylyltransferase, partial [Bacteroidales bacterium]|nr:nicotinate-nucleotide adenylyltransferase [Bacteroidales bacterium]
RRAIEDNYRLRACDVEMRLPVPSYTVVTLARLQEQHPDKQFGLIMGSDNLEGIDRWRNYQIILDNYSLYVYPRPGHPAAKWASHPAVRMVEQCPLMEISSSYIRQQLAQRKSVQYLLPDAVWKYCTEMHFYEGEK